jgi:hypothetical protein
MDPVRLAKRRHFIDPSDQVDVLAQGLIGLHGLLRVNDLTSPIQTKKSINSNDK